MRKKIFLVFLLIMLPGFLVLSLLNISRGQTQQNEKYLSPDVCQSCHTDRYNSYINTLHSKKADPRTPAAKQGCETCHGPGKAHVDVGGGKGVGGIIGLGKEAKLSPAKQNEICLSCHQRGKLTLWKGSTHDSAGKTCTSCHSAHPAGKYPKNLVKKTQQEVCTQCHYKIKTEIQLTSRHPIRDGKMKCSDCHNPHGTVTEKLISANSINDKCYQCHAEKRGPFLWEHAPVREECATCHKPHGSPFNKLLVKKQPILCQNCHAQTRHPGTPYGGNPSEISSRVFNRACLNCHPQIHGSNHPSGFRLFR